MSVFKIRKKKGFVQILFAFFDLWDNMRITNAVLL